MTRKLTVLVVDDSAVVRQVLSRALLQHDAIGTVHTAPTGSLALRKLSLLNPDVVTLDVEMPGMDGLATLERLMASHPRPVIMVSAATHAGASKTLQALDLGAVDFIAKPVGRASRAMAEICEELCDKIVAVAGTRASPLKTRRIAKAARRRTSNREARSNDRIQPGRKPLPAIVRSGPAPEVIAIGASTGGTVAIRTVLGSLAADLPVGVVIVQHMPEAFTASFAERLDEACALEVKEAANRDVIRPGRALVAPGHSHMRVRRGEFGYYVELGQGQPVSGHRPSVDVLFDSVVDCFGSRAIGVLLTGMGRDGADGLCALHAQNSVTVAQDAESCVVYGMPRAAIEQGGASVVAHLSEIGPFLAASCQMRRFSNAEQRRYL